MSAAVLPSPASDTLSISFEARMDSSPCHSVSDAPVLVSRVLMALLPSACSVMISLFEEFGAQVRYAGEVLRDPPVVVAGALGRGVSELFRIGRPGELVDVGVSRRERCRFAGSDIDE